MKLGKVKIVRSLSPLRDIFGGVLLILCVAFVGCVSAGKVENNTRPQYVSLVQLLATPEKYSGKYVHVAGYYHSEFESRGLYLSKDDARYSITENSIWIGADAQGADTNKIFDVNNCHIQAEGIFTSTPQGGGHLGGWHGELNDITLFVDRPERSLSDKATLPQGPH